MALTGRGSEAPVWPWDEPPGRRTVGHRSGSGSGWPVPAATVAVLAGGYGWLGSVIAGTAGAAIGCLLGLLVNGLLHLLVGRATSGLPPSRLPPSCPPTSGPVPTGQSPPSRD
ncbi:hypothetical protein ABZ341_06725 [Streptomyces sp. NPDC006173]|uniref:hypothetical protein n=1 Tax=Streptomyces sp. NPDC006173 TaxID=3155349 RepID=UPI0033EBB0C6